MQAIRNLYNRLEPKERKQVWFLLIFGLLGAYLFYCAWLWDKMFEAERMADRRANRIETRIGELQIPEPAEGISPQRLETLQQQQQEQETQLRQLATELLPLDNVGALLALKQELGRLADASQLQVGAISTQRASNLPPPSSLKSEALRQYLTARPSLQLQLQGNYLALVAFINGLPKLDYPIYVGDISLQPVAEGTGQPLAIMLVLHL